jgi:hypothetical protein
LYDSLDFADSIGLETLRLLLQRSLALLPGSGSSAASAAAPAKTQPKKGKKGGKGATAAADEFESSGAAAGEADATIKAALLASTHFLLQLAQVSQLPLSEWHCEQRF